MSHHLSNAPTEVTLNNALNPPPPLWSNSSVTTSDRLAEQLTSRNECEHTI